MARKWPNGTFRNSVKAWRRHLNLSQVALVERLRELGISTTPATLSRIENGSQNFNAQLLNALADALRCEPQDLVMRHPPSKDDLEIFSVIRSLPDNRKAQAARVLKALAEEAA